MLAIADAWSFSDSQSVNTTTPGSFSAAPHDFELLVVVVVFVAVAVAGFADSHISHDVFVDEFRNVQDKHDHCSSDDDAVSSTTVYGVKQW
jgi:hypothetical protein